MNSASLISITYISFPNYEFLTERQIQKIFSTARDLLSMSPSLAALLILWGIYFLSAIVFLKYKKNSDYIAIRRIFRLILYIFVIIQFCLLNRSQGTTSTVDLTVFHWVENGWLHESLIVEAILNCAVFILLGAFAYLVYKRIWASMIVTVAVSLFIETAQYLTMRGTFSLENIICYLIGGFIGACVLKIVSQLIHI